jgi:hypothetical protein
MQKNLGLFKFVTIEGFIEYETLKNGCYLSPSVKDEVQSLRVGYVVKEMSGIVGKEKAAYHIFLTSPDKASENLKKYRSNPNVTVRTLLIMDCNKHNPTDLEELLLLYPNKQYLYNFFRGYITT